MARENKLFYVLLYFRDQYIMACQDILGEARDLPSGIQSLWGHLEPS